MAGLGISLKGGKIDWYAGLGGNQGERILSRKVSNVIDAVDSFVGKVILKC